MWTTVATFIVMIIIMYWTEKNHLHIKVDAVNTAMFSLMLTMNTKAQTLTSLWLLLVLVGLLCPDIQAGLVQQHKQGKPKNSTVTGKDITPATLKPKHVNKSKTTTTTTSTTAKPTADTLTTNSSEFDLDGRHAYINNQYVSDQEPIHSNSPALYEMLQQHMENVLSTTGLKREASYDSPQGKELIEEIANAPAKPLFSYNQNNFNDYDEEELSEQEEQQTDNCEDTEESLSEDDDSTTNSNVAPTNQHNNYSQTQEQNLQTLAQNSNNQNTPSQSNKPPKQPNDSSNNNSPTYSGQSKKPSASHHHQNTAPLHKEIAYAQTSPNHQTNKSSQTKEKTKPAYNNKHSKLNTTRPQSSSTTQHHKPQSIHKSSKYPSAISQSYPSNTKQQVVLNKPLETNNNHTKRKKSNIDDNSNTNSVTPFSTPASSVGNSDKTPSRRRHLTFRTVSSSTQFVSTPLADLMLKISIGVAKQTKAAVQSNQIQINDNNDPEITSQ